MRTVRTSRSHRRGRRVPAFGTTGHRGRRLLAAGLLAVLAGTTGGQVPAQAQQAAQVKRLEAQRYESVPVQRVKPTKPGPEPEEAAAKVRRPAPVWPAAGSAEVSLTTTAAGARSVAGAGVRAGTLPVTVRPVASASARTATAVPGKVRVEVLPKAKAEAAGINGVLLRVGRTDGVASAGQVEVGVDYAAFASAYGADWSSRLRLVRVPECALNTPGAKGCELVPLASRNEARTRTVSAPVAVAPIRAAVSRTDAKRLGLPSTAALAGTLVAVTSGPSGGAGDFTASSLAPSSSWSHGGATGGFQWSYPMRMPAGPGGPAPGLGLGYSSQAVDGRQAATNNQPGAYGEGFDYSPGFVERQYKSCADDMGGTANNTTKTGDLCWGTENAMLSLNGSSVELLKGSDGKWHPRREDGSKVELLTSPAYSNGDNDNEYWKVTTTDGTQYWFGRHQLPGWSTGRPVTNSVLTVPVFGNNPGEPCNASTFAASDCGGGKKQAWRWNLDYVQDIHGNTMSLWWSKETSHYAKNMTYATPVTYDRAGYLTRIDYGSDNRDNNEYAAGSPYIENVPARVDFTHADRCLANCTTKNATTWPDTPWDQECTATTNPCLNVSPTFWSAKRTTVIATKVWKAVTSSYQAADSWTFRQSFPDPGDGSRAGLWLEGITHRGLNGTTVTAPEVTFSGIQMQNRVDSSGSDWALAMNWWRVNSIRLETGGEIFVTYSPRQCVVGSVMPSSTALDSNTLRCYPVKWTPQGYTDPVTDYFHKYVVTEVQQIDHLGGARPLRTAYEYVNTGNQPLWHYDEDTGLAPDERKSWSQWRGYPTVITYNGEGAERTKSETLYFRGMYGDKLAAGGTRTTQVQGLEGGATNDYDQYAGTPRETVNWLGSTILSATLNEMWRSDPPTATRAGTPIAEARYSRVRVARTRMTTDTGVRRSASTTTFDSYGMPTLQEDSGDDSSAGDERCTQTEYVRNTGNWLLTPTKRINGWVGTCASSPTSEDQITGDTKFSYDSLVYGTAPTKGLLTNTEKLKSFTSGTRLYQQMATAKYDSVGRMVETTDVAGEKTAKAYTPAAGGPVTQVVTTTPLLWTETVNLDPVSGLPVMNTDVNGRVTEYTYDAMGRNLAVWRPGRSKATFPSDPSTSYTYTLSKTAPSSIATKALNARGAYDTSYALLDALSRPRQTQEVAYGGGRILTDTFYDAAGRIYKANSAYYNSGTAGTTLYSGPDADVPSQTRTLYDAAGRQTHSLLLTSVASVQTEKARTSTTYHGDHVTVEPPVGQSATTIWTDAQGRTEKLWQYHSRTAAGTYDETTYTYHPIGQLATVTDASGNNWSYDYDLQGRPISSADPDKGASTLQYNATGDLERTTDSRPDTPDLWYNYDRLGRLLNVREGSLTGAKRLEYTYDLPVKGATRSASRWIGADEYKSETITVDAQYRPTQTKLTLPTSQAGFCGIGATTCSFISKASFRVDGSPNTMTLPAAGGLSQEILTYEYDSTYAMADKLATDYGDASYYAIQSGYTNLFELSTLTRATALTGAKFVQTTDRYDDGTGRVKSSAIIRSTSPSYIANTFYDYDASGNILKIDDNSGARPQDTQCFTYDHQRRLTEAWTPSSYDCGTKPQVNTDVGGPAPYWQQWSFGAPDDPKGRIGNRLTQTERGTSTGTVTTSYSYPVAGAVQPHRLDGWSRTDSTGTTTASYTYDAAGNMKTRPGPNGQQNMAWDAEGHLATLTDSNGANSYIYDAGGNRLIATDPAGSTLFLGDQEVRKNASTGQVDATRYYSFNGEAIAQRTVTGISWLASDHQGTSQVSVGTDTNQTIAQRRQTPYGAPRGGAVSWPNKQGFLGGYQDPTGLTHLGAREYDPTIGRFISVDPINDPGNPQQLPAYTYAANNPITYSDPSGEIIPEYGNPAANGLDVCAFLNVGGYACQNMMEGTTGQGEGEDTRPASGSGFPKKSGSQKAHESLEACGLFIAGLGAVCDGINAGIYIKEGNWKEAALSGVSSIPVVDWACKIKSFCKQAIGWVGDKAKALVGKAPLGKAPAINPAAEAREMNALKQEIRQAAKNPPPPKTPKPPTKETGPGNKGKTGGENGGGAPRSRDGCPTHSFDPATPVLMADGTERPIAEVRVGDEVLSQDPETGDSSAEAVERLHVNQDEELTDLVIRNKDGKFGTLRTTQHHPVWSESRKEWTDAGDLRPAEWLKTPTGDAAIVARIQNFLGHKTMRDLTVSNVHTYFVVVGKIPVLVHNCGASHKTLPSRNAAFRDAKRDLGIPMSQQPEAVRSVPMTAPRGGSQIMNESYQPVMTREYIFVRGGGERVVIQDHSFGHRFGEGGVGDQGPHLNVRPWDNVRTGKVPGAAEHYEY
ncbi:HNH/endonuclease VII fold putative polymorphic toxin [Micromonospora sp. CA-111912]|uniref:HNH/endonuclease VII fold putative polymorphic toxin n=1 Tax=Micromonospora sp. CA-111912 TaxID=3239955 RepID=UPI003D92AE9B